MREPRIRLRIWTSGPGVKPAMSTASPRWSAYESRRMFPNRLIHQKARGKWLCPSRSVNHHCTTKRVLQIVCPITAHASQSGAPVTPSRPRSRPVQARTAVMRSASTARGNGESPGERRRTIHRLRT